MTLGWVWEKQGGAEHGRSSGWELNIHGEGTSRIRILDPFIGRSLPGRRRISFVRYWLTLALTKGNDPCVMLNVSFLGILVLREH